MSEPTQTTITQTNLDELRERVLGLIAAPAAVVGLVWLLLIWPDVGPSPTWQMWLGSLALLLGSLAAFIGRRRYQMAANRLIVTSLVITITCIYSQTRINDSIYLYSAAIVIASVLLPPSATVVVAGITLLLEIVLVVGLGGAAPLSGRVLYPLVVTLVVTGASVASARTLYAALDWVWQGYEQALRSQRTARETGADLRQALRSLDEATYRIERTNRMLSLAREQAVQARQLKQRFAQNISHELRTPLNLIVEYSAMMAQSPEYYGGPLPPAYLRDLSIVHRNANHLQGMVSDVLDLARIEAAQVGLQLVEADPAEVVRNAVETARGLIEAKGLRLRVQLQPELPRLRLDRTRIRQVLFNLINNAVRFTDQGSVTVSARQLEDEVVFCVRDTGVGMKPEDLQRIFNEFEQIDDGTNRRHGGVGLGLSISKGFVELHGGRIWAESQLGEGSIFSFALPTTGRVPPNPAHDKPSTPRPHPEDEELLLVVTKNLAGAALIARHVHGARTIVECELDQARVRAQALLPQVVLVDQALLDVQQVTITDYVQALELEAPVISCPLPGEERLRRTLTVAGYLIKPITMSGLMDTLRPFGNTIDRIQIIDDDPDFVRMLQRFLSTSIRKYQVSTANSGTAGLAMMRQRRPDLLLLDLGLTGMQGQDIATAMQADSELAEIPIVVVSGQEQIDRLRLLEGSFAVVCPQGLEVGHIVQWVQGVVDTAVSRQSLPTGLVTQRPQVG
jgi:signal transduction histidine kinase/CheY-like chemotaxis protein